MDFLAFEDYWGGKPDIEVLRVQRYDSHEDVKARHAARKPAATRRTHSSSHVAADF